MNTASMRFCKGYLHFGFDVILNLNHDYDNRMYVYVYVKGYVKTSHLH